MPCRLLSSTPGLYPPDASITPSLVVTTQSVSRCCLVSPRGARSPPLRRAALWPTCQLSCCRTLWCSGKPQDRPTSSPLAPRAPSDPLTGHFPWQRGLRARHPLPETGTQAAEAIGRLFWIYSSRKEVSCSHWEGPPGWGWLLRTFFRDASLHTKQLFATVSPRAEGTRLVARGTDLQGLSLECPCPSPLLLGRRQDWFFSLETKPGTPCSIESKFPRLTLLRRGPGASSWGAVGRVARSINRGWGRGHPPPGRMPGRGHGSRLPSGLLSIGSPSHRPLLSADCVQPRVGETV